MHLGLSQVVHKVYFEKEFWFDWTKNYGLLKFFPFGNWNWEPQCWLQIADISANFESASETYGFIDRVSPNIDWRLVNRLVFIKESSNQKIQRILMLLPSHCHHNDQSSQHTRKICTLNYQFPRKKNQKYSDKRTRDTSLYRRVTRHRSRNKLRSALLYSF